MPAIREVWAEGPSLLTSMARHWFAVLVAGAVLGGATYMVASGQEPVYETAAVLEFGGIERQPLDPDEPARTNPARRMRNRAGQMQSRAVLERASELLGGTIEPESLRLATEIEVDADVSDSIVIVARWGDPEEAAAIANAVAEAYQEVTSEQERERARQAMAELEASVSRLHERLGQLDTLPDDDTVSVSVQRRSALNQLVELTTRRAQLDTVAELADAGVTAYEPAARGWQVAPRPTPFSALAAIFGLGLGSAYAYWREGRGGVVRRASDARALLDAPLLGELPRARARLLRPGVPADLLDRRTEPYQFLAVALEGQLDGQQASSVVFAGVSRGRGTSTVAMNTAFALCEDRRRVVLVDANLRQRRLTRLWRMDDHPGLVDLGDPAMTVAHVSTVAGLVGDGTWLFVPAGTPQPDAYRCLRGRVVPRLLEELEAERRIGQSLRVVLQAPPVTDVADASAIAPLTDGIVLLVFAGTDLQDVRRARDAIEVAGGRLLGFVTVDAGRRRRKRTRGRRSHRHRPAATKPQPTPVP